MTLTQIIKEWLGEDELKNPQPHTMSDLQNLVDKIPCRNKLRQELRTKLPELEKQIGQAFVEALQKNLPEPMEEWNMDLILEAAKRAANLTDLTEEETE